ncbi:MAG: methyltransferase domain-containing protein [Propionicimonas sp.]
MEAYSRLAGVYDEIVVDPCFPVWAGFLDGLWHRDHERVHRVLDVCCGTGLLAAELTARGYRVTGIDASTQMLDRARALLGPDADLERVVLPDLPVTGIFDAAVSTFDGLNYLELPAFRQTLVALATKLRPGGWLVFDLHTDAMLQLALRTPTVAGEQDGTSFVIENLVDPLARTCDARIEVTPSAGGEPYTELHRQYFHSADEVRSALADAGFELVSVTTEYTDVPVDDDTLRATWTARRPQGAGRSAQ